MSYAIGLFLGVGLVLAASPWLWPDAAIPPARNGTPSRAREHLALAGLRAVSPLTVVVVSVLLAAISGAIVFVFVPVVALAAVAAAVALLTPSVLVLWRARQQRRIAATLWPDVVDHLVSGIRSGLALPDSVVALATTGPPRTRGAFSDFASSYRSTGDFALCLDELKDSLADPVADRIIETLRMAREVGGTELTVVLRNLAAYLRQEAALRAEVLARQSWVLNAARLGVAAPWIVLGLLASRAEAAAAYNTVSGSIVISAGLAVTVVAYWLMLRIGRLAPEQRWFR